MRAWLTQFWFTLRGNFWLLPTVLAVVALGASVLVVQLDETRYGGTVTDWLPFPQIGAEGARLVVSTVAGSMITVASLVFSLTLIALTLMSQQLGPRMLPIFMTDRITQLVLGFFVAAFLFSLVILSTIGTGERGEFVPQLSIYVVCLIAIAAFFLMIYFVHHIARSIQADSVIAFLSTQLDQAIDDILKAEGHDEDDAAVDPDDYFIGKETRTLAAERSGYIQQIDYESALSLATEAGLHVRYLCFPGRFALDGAAMIETVGGPVSDDLSEDLLSTLSFGHTRSPAQQVEYEFNALLEVALRALSPGVNDPFTAIACIDHLADALLRVMRMPNHRRYLADDDGTPRVFRYPQTFSHFMTQVVNPLRQAATGTPIVLHHLAQALASLIELSPDDPTRQVAVAHARRLMADCREQIVNADDRDQIGRLLERVGV